MAYSLDKIKQDLLLTQPSFEQMNMNKVSFAQEMEFAIQAFTANPKLLDCDQNTLRNCLVNIALSGLTLSPVMKMAHLVPRKGKCCVDPSYMGLIKIITDTGSVQSIKAKPVYENEPFEIELGSGGFVKHGIYRGTGNKGKRIGAYSIAVLNDGSDHIEWMYESELMEIKVRAQKTGGAVWGSDENEMCRKTVVKRHWKYLPKSERAALAANAIAFDDENNGIDFEEEKKAKKQGSSTPEATPNAPVPEAEATNDDFSKMFELLSNVAFANVVCLHYLPNVKVEVLFKQLTAKQKDGLPKSKAEEYIELLEHEVIWWTDNPAEPKQEGAE